MPDNGSERTDDAEPPSRGGLKEKLARLISGRQGADENTPLAGTHSTTIGLRLRDFENATVRSVMTPRGDVTAVDVEATLEEVLKQFVDNAHSRMPVFKDSLDAPLGFVHIKDVLAELVGAGWSPETLASRPLERILRKTMFVPESKPLPDLLLQMQTERTHMAIVVDEFGGTDGLVCLEDVVEEIVGDLEDEHDDISASVEKRGRQVWDVDGLTEIEDVEEATGLSLEMAEFEDEIETIGGLVSALAGRVPKAGDTISHPSGWQFDVLAADPRRVMRVRLRPDLNSAFAKHMETKAPTANTE